MNSGRLVQPSGCRYRPELMMDSVACCLDGSILALPCIHPFFNKAFNRPCVIDREFNWDGKCTRLFPLIYCIATTHVGIFKLNF